MKGFFITATIVSLLVVDMIHSAGCDTPEGRRRYEAEVAAEERERCTIRQVLTRDDVKLYYAPCLNDGNGLYFSARGTRWDRTYRSGRTTSVEHNQVPAQ